MTKPDALRKIYKSRNEYIGIKKSFLSQNLIQTRIEDNMWLLEKCCIDLNYVDVLLVFTDDILIQELLLF